MARFNPCSRPRSRGQDTQARIEALGREAVEQVMAEAGVGERRACAQIERERGLLWIGAGQYHRLTGGKE